MEMKTREMTDLFCDLDGITDPEARDRRYNRGRALALKGLIKPTADDIGRGKVARFDIEEVAVARLLLQLTELGIGARPLRGFEHGFRPPQPEEAERHIRNVLPEIAAGEHWEFRVTVKLDDRGEVLLAGGFYREGAPSPWQQHREALVAFDKSQGHSRHSVITLDATGLLQPLLEG